MTEDEQQSTTQRTGETLAAVLGFITVVTGAVLVCSAAWWAILWLWWNLPSRY